MSMKKTITVLLLALSSLSSIAQEMPKAYAQLLKEVEPELISWRRYIHEHPELSNREVNTGKFISDYLKTLPGIEVRYPVALTGVVGVLKGGKPGPTIALRADIDALPVLERTPVPFASKVTTDYMGKKVNVMHACGHDSHIAMLMATAKVLSSLQKDVPGTVVFVFQPAEEGPPGTEEGGAPLMIKEGVLNNPKVDAIFGIHISSETPVGVLTYKSGSFMASSDWFTIKVNGKGSHGSQPWGGVDPIATSAQIIEGLQHIVSRQMDLTKAPLVITVGTIQGGVRSNIIPEFAEMSGTIRTLDSKMQKEVHERIKFARVLLFAFCYLMF
jgi:amidohydrolase